MRENRTSGSVVGAPGNRSPYAGGVAALVPEAGVGNISPYHRHSCYRRVHYADMARNPRPSP